MYTPNNGNQVNLGQYLADQIIAAANQGPVQNVVWQKASYNQYQNDYFAQLVNTVISLADYWAQIGRRDTLETMTQTVYMCACGTEFARNHILQQQSTQQDGDTWMEWAQYGINLDAELTQFENQMRRAPVANPTGGAWDSARYAGNNNAPRGGGGWAMPQQPQHRAGWQQPAQAPQADWAHRGGNAGYVSPAPARAAQQVSASSTAPRQGFKRRGAAAADPQQPAPVQFTKPTGTSSPQFSQPTSKYRGRGTRFNPNDAQHQPVGREVAEAHEAAAAAGGSWETSNFEWDDANVVFSEPEPTPTVSTVKPTNTNTPQFMERHSSNKDVPHMVYGVTENNEFREFTLEDWTTKPDPDFPWEMAYKPGTHTRRIAYDVKRDCYVQLIEENKVKYDDHAVVEESAAVRTTLASRKQRGASGRGFSGDSNKVASLPGLIQQRTAIIDNRLESARETWQKQEEDAHQNLKEGENYVAPDLDPPREDVIATPLADETPEQIALAENKLTEDQLVTVDLGDAGFINEQHAQFAMQAKVAVDGFEFADVPAISTKYVEVTPFVLSNEDPESVMEKLEALTDDSTINNFIGLAKHLSSIAGDIPVYLWNHINDQCTMYVNGILETELALAGLAIDSFAEDAAALPEYIKTNKGEEYLQALSRRIAEFIRPLLCVVNTNLTQNSFDAILANILPDADAVSNLTLLNNADVNLVDRTVLVRRECTLTRLNRTSEELGLFTNSNQFTIDETTAPDLFKVLSDILAATARDDGKAGFFKRVLLLDDGSRFTIHEGWVAKKPLLILKR